MLDIIICQMSLDGGFRFEKISILKLTQTINVTCKECGLKE
jgi:hypothetical protein